MAVFKIELECAFATAGRSAEASFKVAGSPRCDHGNEKRFVSATTAGGPHPSPGKLYCRHPDVSPHVRIQDDVVLVNSRKPNINGIG